MEIPFSFRVKMGKHEIEISGTREEVIKTIEELPSLMASISKAFESTKNARTASKSVTSTYPSISSSSCSEAVLQLLGTDWGKQSRTLTELGEALKANALHYPSTTISGVLAGRLIRVMCMFWLEERRENGKNSGANQSSLRRNCC